MALFKLKKKVAVGVNKVLGDDRLLKIIAPLPDIEKYSRFLFIGPHPDDIEIGAGATVDKLIKAGKTVKMLICTDGGCGSTDASLTRGKIAETRAKEQADACRSLGVEDHEVLSFPDGGDYREWDLAIEIAKRIYDFVPDVVLCPDPNLPTETHPDHLKCGRATNSALLISSYYHMGTLNGLEMDPAKIKENHIIAYYYTHRANSFIAIDDSNVLSSLKALKLHRSQMPGSMAESLSLYLAIRADRMGEKCGAKQAEGFCVLHPMHQHCVTETVDW